MSQAMTHTSALESGIRGRHARLTRQTILEALADLLAEGELDFSVQDVADRAGVSHRTVYRHFETRETLLDALVDLLEQRLMEHIYPVRRAEDVAASIRHNFRLIEGFSPAVEALIALGIAGDTHSRYTRRRTKVLLGALSEVTAHLPPDAAAAVQWTIRHPASHPTWVRLRRDAGIEGERSGEAVAWAVETLLETLRSGRGPGADADPLPRRARRGPSSSGRPARSSPTEGESWRTRP